MHHLYREKYITNSQRRKGIWERMFKNNIILRERTESIMKKRIVTVSALCVMLSLLLLTGKKSSAIEYIYYNEVYRISSTAPKTYTLQNTTANNNLNISAYARPDASNQKNSVYISKNKNGSDRVTDTVEFVGANPGTRIRFTLPVNTTYYARISTTTPSMISGVFTAYY